MTVLKVFFHHGIQKHPLAKNQKQNSLVGTFNFIIVYYAMLVQAGQLKV